MKRRLALTTLMAVALSLVGMVPASAAKLGAPTVASDACTRAGDTLSILQDAGDQDLVIGRDASDLLVDNGSSDDCDADDLALFGLAKVIIKGADSDDVDVSFDLESHLGDRLANFSAITFTVQVDGVIEFDGDDIAGALSPVRATVTEEAFTVGTLKGTYYAGDSIQFWGTEGADVFDASGVLTTDIVADGDEGSDTLKGGAGDDHLVGGGGGDDAGPALDPRNGDGNDKLYGGAGDDDLDTSDKGEYDDLATVLSTDQAWGGAGDDTLLVDGADTAAPGDGEDTITGTATVAVPADLFVGSLYYGDSSAAISVDLDEEVGVVRSTAGDDYYDADGGVYSFVGSSFADTFVGSDGDDAFVGGEGADKLFGFGGDDYLAGGGGADNIKGGLGDDEIAGDSGADKINGGGGNDTVEGGGGDDIMYGSTGDDVLKGMNGSDQAWGGKGRDDICSAEVTDGCEFKK